LGTIRERLTYANVMATIAVFLSLAGGAYAALRVPPHSVGNRQLRKNAVSGAKVKDGSLTGAEIADGSLTGADVMAGSLTAANLGRVGLANLLGASGTATNNATVSQAARSCGRYQFSAPGVQPGDAVILGGSDAVDLLDGIVAGPTVTNPNQLNVSICAGQESAVSEAPGAVQLRYDTLR
jgi:hypothetical protein